MCNSSARFTSAIACILITSTRNTCKFILKTLLHVSCTADLYHLLLSFLTNTTFLHSGFRDYLAGVLQDNLEEEESSDYNSRDYMPQFSNDGASYDHDYTDAPIQDSVNLPDEELLEHLQTCSRDSDCTKLHQFCITSQDLAMGLCGCVEGYSLDFNSGRCMSEPTATTISYLHQGFCFCHFVFCVFCFTLLHGNWNVLYVMTLNWFKQSENECCTFAEV